MYYKQLEILYPAYTRKIHLLDQVKMKLDKYNLYKNHFEPLQLKLYQKLYLGNTVDYINKDLQQNNYSMLQAQKELLKVIEVLFYPII